MTAEPETTREAADSGLALVDVVVGTGGQPITWACVAPAGNGRRTPVVDAGGWAHLLAWHSTENRWVVLDVRGSCVVAIVPRTWPTTIPLPPAAMLEESPRG